MLFKLALALSIILPSYSATWYVATTGNDSNSCSVIGSPCLSINGAYQKAASADTIQVAAGTYGDQTLTSSPGKASAVFVQPAPGADVNLGILLIQGATYLDIRDMDATEFQVEMGSNFVTIRNVNVQYLGYTGGSNITMIGGSVGPVLNAHPQIAPVNGWQGEGVNFVFDGVYFHDVTRNDPMYHVECLQVAGTTNMIIRNSKFQRCDVFDLSFTEYNNSGKVTNLLLENNFFDTAGDGGFFSVHFTGMNGGTARFNSSTQAMVVEKDTSSNTGTMTITGNNMAGGILDGTSGVCIGSSMTAVYRYNVTQGWQCDPTDANASPGFVNASTLNLNLQSGATAIGFVPLSESAPSNDINGTSRPQGSANDAGASEFVVAGPSPYWIRTGPRYVITGTNTTSPVQVTLDASPGWSIGQKVYCIGVQANVGINGRHTIASIAGNVITLNEEDGSTPTQGYAGTNVPADQFNLAALGYCGAITEYTLRADNRGVYQPITNNTLYTRLVGSGGPGSGTSTVPTDDPAGWAALNTAVNSFYTVGCNGVTGCTKEAAALVANGQNLTEGVPVVLLALGWQISGNASMLGAVKYYLDHVEQLGVLSNTWAACIETMATFCGTPGSAFMANDYMSFNMADWSRAYRIVYSQLTPTQRQNFAAKLVNGLDPANPKTNQAQLISAAKVTGTISTNTVTGIAGSGFLSNFSPGDKIYISWPQQTRAIDDGTLTNIVVTSSGATSLITINFASPGILVSQDSGYVKIRNSGVTNLDGDWPATANSNGTSATFIVTATVALGTYSTAGMTAEIWQNFNTQGQWNTINTITDNTHLTTTTALNASFANAYIYRIDPWTINHNGLLWAAFHHTNNTGLLDNHRRAILNGAVSYGSAINVTTATVNNFRGLTLPACCLQFVNSPEMIQLDAVDFSTGALTVTRGLNGTPQTRVTNGSSAIYFRHWPRAFNSSTGQYAIMAGDPQENLNVTRVVPVAEIMGNIIDDAPANTASLFYEPLLNTFIDVELERTKRQWTPQSPGGLNLGYQAGRYWEFTSNLILHLKDSLVPSLDLTGPFMCRVPEYYAYINMPYAVWNLASAGNAPYTVQGSDAGSTYAPDGDDHKTLIDTNYLCGNSQGQRWGNWWLTQYTYFWNGLSSFPDSEMLGHRLAYYPSSTPREDFTTNAPRFRSFSTVDTQDPLVSSYSVNTGQSSFAIGDNPSKVWIPCLSRPGDHVGTNPRGCQVNLYQANTAASSRVKGSPLIGSASKATATWNDGRFLEGLLFDPIPAMALGAQTNATQTVTVHLNQPAGANGSFVTLTSSNSALVPPWGVYVAPNATTATFTLFGYNSSPAGTQVTGTITGTSTNTSDGYTTMTGNFECNPCTPVSNGTIVSVTAPNGFSTTGGGQVLGRVTINANASNGGSTIALSSSDPNVVVPASVRIRTGKTTIDFPVSFKPSTSPLSATITATAGNVVGSASPFTATALANAPVNANVALVQTSTTSATGGYFYGSPTAPPLFRQTASKVDSTFLYVKGNGKGSFLSTQSPNDQYIREVIYYAPATNAASYVITYDSLLQNTAGYLATWQVPYFRGLGDSSVDDPVRTNNVPSMSGNTVTYVKPDNSVMVTTKVLLPVDATKMRSNFGSLTATDYGAFLRVNGGYGTGRIEFLGVHKPHAGTSDTLTASLLSSDADHEAVFIDDPANKFISVFAKANHQANDSATYLMTSASSTLHMVSSLSPGSTYAVTINGNPVASPTADGAGVITFTTAAVGTVAVVLSGSPVPLLITTASPLPPGDVNQPYGPVSFTCTGGVLPYTWSIVGSPSSYQTGLSLTSGGVLSGTPTVANTTAPNIQCADSVGTTPYAKVLSLTVNSMVSPVSITTASLPDCNEGSSYNQTLAATGGVLPYTWSVVSGDLPTGINLNASTGQLTGTCTAAGAFSPEFQVADSNTPSSQTDTATIPVTVNGGPLSITPNTGSIDNGTYLSSYSYQFNISGGTPPYTVIASGQPTGLSIDANGLITGTPTAIGNFTINVQVTDSAGTPQQALANVTMSVYAVGTGLSIDISSKGSSAIFSIYRPALDANQSCRVAVWDTSNNQIINQVIPPGPSVRTLGTETLTQGQQYTINATCGAHSGFKVFTVGTTTGGSTGATIGLSGKAASTATVYYGTAPTFGNSTAPQACSTGCTVSLPNTLQRGNLYYIGWQYNSGPITQPVPFIP